MRSAIAMCRRLHALTLCLYLSYRVWGARRNAEALEAEMLAAPMRIKMRRAYIARATQRIEQLMGGL